MGTVQGIACGSKEEWRLALALEHWKMTFQFQVSIYGGRTVRGGLVVDFVVYNPLPIPIQVHGEYWHTGAKGAYDVLEDAAIEHKFGHPPVIFWGAELASLEMAIAGVREKLL